MRLEVGCVDHERVDLATQIGEFQEHPRKDAFLAPPLPAAVQRLVRTIRLRCIPPAQPIAVDEDNPAQDALVIDAWFAVGLREEWLQLGHLIVTQPV